MDNCATTGQQDFNAVSANYLEGPNEYVFEFDLSPDDPAQPTEEDEINERFNIMKAELESLREAQVLATQQGRREKFDGVEVPQRKTGPPPRKNPPVPQPNVHGQRDPFNPINKDPPPHLAGKPGALAGTSQNRPQGPIKPIAMQPKPSADESRTRYHAAIEDSAKASDILERVLDIKIPVSAREILAVSNDARRQVKDLVTSKKVSANLLEAGTTDSTYRIAETSPFDVYEYSSPSAAPFLPLRVITLNLAPGVTPECILDGGSQIVVMRRDVWEKLRVPITADRAMKMESANSGTTLTLGEIENFPVKIGPVTVHLQIQVVPSAPFEVLLGRPFFDVLNCTEYSRAGGVHEIEIKDPETGTPYVFATQPRQHKNSKGSAVNFRM